MLDFNIRTKPQARPDKYGQFLVDLNFFLDLSQDRHMFPDRKVRQENAAAIRSIMDYATATQYTNIIPLVTLVFDPYLAALTPNLDPWMDGIIRKTRATKSRILRSIDEVVQLLEMAELRIGATL